MWATQFFPTPSHHHVGIPTIPKFGSHRANRAMARINWDASTRTSPACEARWTWDEQLGIWITGGWPTP